MKTLIAFVLMCGCAMAASGDCANGRCTKAVISAPSKVVKATVRPLRRVVRGR